MDVVGSASAEKRQVMQAQIGLDDMANEYVAATSSKRDLEAKLIKHCEVMLEYAMASGLQVPPALIGRLDTYFVMRSTGVAPKLAGLAFSNGTSDGAPAMPSPLEELADICKLLTTLVAPATPAAIQLFAEERKLHPRLSAIGAIPIARKFLVLSMVSLLTTLLIGLLEEVNTENISKSFLQTSGWPLFYVEMFLLSAASLGSCFGILQKLNGYIADSTYDPKYQGTYWTRWVMGVISGVLISQLLTSWLEHPGEGGLAPVELPNLGQTTLALLGGYSAGVVHRLLGRIMSGIETMFGGKA